jgi:hypothetical protein
MKVTIYFNTKYPIDIELFRKLQEMTGQTNPSSPAIKHYLWLALCQGRGVEYPQGQVTHTPINTGDASRPTDSKSVEQPDSPIDLNEPEDWEMWDGGLS